MRTTITLPIGDRAILAFDQLLKRQDEKVAQHGFGITDSDVLDTIDRWTTGPCPEDRACSSDDCCDYQRISSLVWLMVERSAE